MFLVGLTGGIASGKSSVIQVFQQLGCAVVDVDVIARHGELEGGGWDVHSNSPAPLSAILSHLCFTFLVIYFKKRFF